MKVHVSGKKSLHFSSSTLDCIEKPVCHVVLSLMARMYLIANMDLRGAHMFVSASFFFFSLRSDAVPLNMLNFSFMYKVYNMPGKAFFHCLIKKQTRANGETFFIHHL